MTKPEPQHPAGIELARARADYDRARAIAVQTAQRLVAAGATEQAVADALGVNRATIRAWRGKRWPSQY